MVIIFFTKRQVGEKVLHQNKKAQGKRTRNEDLGKNDILTIFSSKITLTYVCF